MIFSVLVWARALDTNGAETAGASPATPATALVFFRKSRRVTEQFCLFPPDPMFSSLFDRLRLIAALRLPIRCRLPATSPFDARVVRSSSVNARLVEGLMHERAMRHGAGLRRVAATRQADDATDSCAHLRRRRSRPGMPGAVPTIRPAHYGYAPRA